MNERINVRIIILEDIDNEEEEKLQGKDENVRNNRLK